MRVPKLWVKANDVVVPSPDTVNTDSRSERNLSTPSGVTALFEEVPCVVSVGVANSTTPAAAAVADVTVADANPVT